MTKHAIERGKERMGLNRKALKRMAKKALVEGKPHSSTRGRLRKYITKLFFQEGKANNTKIYGEFIYLFHNDLLITVYNLPNNFKTYG